MAALTAGQLRQRTNELTAGYFALAMLGLMAIFTAVHHIDRVLQSSSAKTGSSGRITTVLRRCRSLLLKKVPGFPSFGHLIVFVVYVMINIVLSFQNLNWATLNNFAKRLGWISICNLALIAVLALKNTPLAFLTSYSYERLNILHQAAGYVTIFWSLTHGVVYVTAWSYSNSLEELKLFVNVMGIVAGFAMLMIVISAVLIRTNYYEIFYVMHITLFMLVVIVLGLHRPDLSKKTLYIIFFIAAIWGLDRLVRSSRVLVNCLGNTATLTVLPRGGVKITLKRTPWRTVPGSHLFLWLPAVRAIETHPFTVVNTNPLELVVSAHDGFTKDLRRMAEETNEQVKLRCSVDGPYGALPAWMNFQKVILVAGGGGGSFTFGVANDILNQIDLSKYNGKAPVVHLIWVVRDTANLVWFAPHLRKLQASSHIRLSIHVTGHTSGSITPTEPTMVDEKEMGVESKSSQKAINDLEKSVSLSATSADVPTDLHINSGRPDITMLLKQLIAQGETDSERIVVGACGPESMMRDVRRTVAEEVGSGTKSIRLHTESFGW